MHTQKYTKALISKLGYHIFVFFQVWVQWFGEQTHSLVSRCNIKDLREGVMKRLSVKPLSKNLKCAILKAIQAAIQDASN